MHPDTPQPPRPHRASVVLALAPVLLIALGAPYALHLDARASAAVTLSVLAAAAVAASATRRALSARPASSDHVHVLREVTDTLTHGALVLVDGELRAANGAARAILHLGDDDTALPAASGLFENRSDADAALFGAAVEKNLRLRPAHGQPIDVRLSVGEAHVDGHRIRLLMLGGGGPDGELAARLDAQRIELQTLTRRLMTVQEDERASLSRELHDDIGQAITTLKLCASSLAHEPDPPRHAVVLETAHEIAQIADQTVAKLRDLSLLLRPPQLDALGLESALRWQAGALFRGDLPHLRLDIPRLACRPPREVELACFRIAQEALTNVLRHARAGAVSLHLACDDTQLHLRVIDDGCGIDTRKPAGLGLITMRERAKQVGGVLTVDSRPGRTCIDALLPLPPDGEARAARPQG
ncbi:sensor histidine kinase [Cognatilysobacter lacus]|uniref:Sensor histidine kinase n=1 Tax=Cognatilysobacter lacus TaxID=1643323 RepID=A0A5D8ZB73_9GAMM|nr:sensor histidine kinase [Lysobacter lacus]TZF89934.1 sensor histidine kinase [Lysobacter lacus]